MRRKLDVENWEDRVYHGTVVVHTQSILDLFRQNVHQIVLITKGKILVEKMTLNPFEPSGAVFTEYVGIPCPTNDPSRCQESYSNVKIESEQSRDSRDRHRCCQLVGYSVTAVLLKPRSQIETFAWR